MLDRMTDRARGGPFLRRHPARLVDKISCVVPANVVGNTAKAGCNRSCESPPETAIVCAERAVVPKASFLGLPVERAFSARHRRHRERNSSSVSYDERDVVIPDGGSSVRRSGDRYVGSY